MFLWYGDMQENIEPYKKLNIGSDSKETFQWVRSEDIKQGDIIWIGEDEPIPCDGVAIGSSDKMFQVNMSLLNGEISPHKKYPIDLGMTLSQKRAMTEDGDFKFFKALKVWIKSVYVTLSRELLSAQLLLTYWIHLMVSFVLKIVMKKSLTT
jgi:P-type E1-E2 ATPase